jgi:hypothetical protein
MAYEVREADIEAGGPGRQVGRLLATLIGVGLLVVGAFLDWTPGRTGDRLTIKALVQTDFGAQSDLVKTVGGLAILIGLVALIGLVDRTGWFTRLAGAAALVLFVMFAIEAYRFYGNDFSTAVHDVRIGFWLQLAAGIVLLIGGFFGARVVAGVPASVEAPRSRNEQAEQDELTPRHLPPVR